MKLKFENNLEYQAEAINAVVDLFEGCTPNKGEYDITLDTVAYMGTQQTEMGIGNYLSISPWQMRENLHNIQSRNLIEKSAKLLDDAGEYPFANFSVEMETGTGKTYVYLRTIFDLNRKYGFSKFIIVVPSVAVREGVLSSINIMREHFAGLYDNKRFRHFVYNSKDVNELRHFAQDKEIQIMIINIQAFQKDAGDIEDYSKLSEEQVKKLNVIHREDDRSGGYRWIEYIQKTNPIVIIDEPQSVDNTPKAKRAIQTLKPLLALRYSATHINPYNLLYKLDPVRAYDLKLVKQIEVASVRAQSDFNDTFIRLDKIHYSGQAKTPQAKVTIYEDTANGPREKSVTIKQGKKGDYTDLAMHTNRKDYEGYIVANICAEPGLEHIEFSNGVTLELSKETGGMGDEVLKAQVRQTVEEHFKKEKRFRDKGIKVLSLFFIDKVANYRWYDEQGNPQNGKIAQWFEESYREMVAKPMYKGLLDYPVEMVHDGYFAADRKKGKVVAFKDSSGTTQADEQAYELIMKDKERLLSQDEPLRFIFSHSALKEGWDNPNVFQICSLREMGTENQRRQTIGRGLRLPVNSEGVRIYDESINRLTVIAGESFEQYAAGLQADIESDMGSGFKFGKVEKIAFANLSMPGSERAIGQETSAVIWQELIKAGYLDKEGTITDEFAPEQKGFKLELPLEFVPLQAAVIDEMKRYIFKNRISKSGSREKLKYNKRVELNEDFKALWQKINKKTRYRVEFTTDELIKLASGKIATMEEIKPVSILIDKTEVEINKAGVEGGRVLDSKTQAAGQHGYLPDVLAYLQRETELTRGTLVEILKQCGRLKEFLVNPQAFMSEAAKLINRALHEMVIDGIKYQQVEGHYYEMRLFEETEIETYLNRLYAVQSSDNRTPYDFVPYDSEVEREVAEKLDTNENVKFFCKLPNWFVVPTPLGDYNPDWAVVTQNEQKLYLVRETKSTHDASKRRETENRKIQCGKAHFAALNVNFKVATDIREVLAE